MAEGKHKRRLKNAYYSVYDINTDEFVMGGTVAEICDRLDIVKSTVCKAITNDSIVRKRYRIYYDN